MTQKVKKTYEKITFPMALDKDDGGIAVTNVAHLRASQPSSACRRHLDNPKLENRRPTLVCGTYTSPSVGGL